MDHNSTISVLLYTTNEYRKYSIDNDTCSEVICQEICKDLEIKPLVCSLFALRTNETQFFLPGCRKPMPNAKYEFRLRFQVCVN